MEQPAATFPFCTLIKSDGTRCGSPALSGMNLCFQHIGGRIPSPARPKPEPSASNTQMKFAYPGDREAIQHNLFLVAQALSDGKIDNATANTYNRVFRSCDQNLRRWETAKQRGVAERMFPLPEEAPEPSEQPSFADQNSPLAPPSDQEQQSPHHNVVIPTGAGIADLGEEQQAPRDYFPSPQPADRYLVDRFTSEPDFSQPPLSRCPPTSSPDISSSQP